MDERLQFLDALAKLPNIRQSSGLSLNMKALLIPVKDPSRGKTRLSATLSQDDRRALAWAMLEDVFRAAASSTVDRVVVVTNFRPALAKARAAGFDVLVEQNQVSESESVDWASRVLKEQGFDVVMRLPADVPLVRPRDIDSIVASSIQAPGALLVPSRDGTGTNAVVRTPPDLFPSRFGPNSLSLHIEEASRLGIECLIVKNERIALDIDEPADIEILLLRGQGTAAFNLLSEMKRARRE